jgi:hypothetical protein
MHLKTAKDLPPGAQVKTFWTDWTKTSTTQADCWTNELGDRFTNDDIDRVLARGAQIWFIPTGAGAAARNANAERE